MKELSLSKASHMGTLDPQVTGVLPITLGRACKLSKYFMHKNKTYVGIMRLHEKVSKSKLETNIIPLLGKITQLPPVRSAVKRAERERTIHSFKILEIKDKDVMFETEVEAGTYIRKLIHDLGEKIGGAHMLELRRTKAGIFDESTALNLYDFDKALENKSLDSHLVPAEEAIKKILPTIQIQKENLKALLDGKPLMKADIKDKLPKEETFAAFLDKRFIAIYSKHIDGDIIAKAEFVYN